MEIQVRLENRAALTVVNAEAQDPVVPRALETGVHQSLEKLLLLNRRPVVDDSQVALVRCNSRIQRIRSVERNAVLARLQVVEAVGDLGQSHAKTMLLVRVDVDVRIQVAELAEGG